MQAKPRTSRLEVRRRYSRQCEVSEAVTVREGVHRSGWRIELSSQVKRRSVLKRMQGSVCEQKGALARVALRSRRIDLEVARENLGSQN